MKEVRTRIAPSPTGEDIHIGNLYTALINYAVAVKNNGSFIIRIEDTDRTRLVPGAVEKIITSLKRYNLTFQEGPEIGGRFGPYVQSERLELYKKHALHLVDMDKAYVCFCSKEKLEKLKAENTTTRHWLVCENKNDKNMIGSESYVVRLKVPQGKQVIITDLIRGEIIINTDQFDDQVLIKSDGFPTYHMAVVVDDHLMEISHVIRAEEWISSTPKHVMLYEALGWDIPIFAHVPILRNPDKSKLSKRKNPVWASWYIDQGYLPQAVLNYLCLMGWSHPDQKDIFSLTEFIEKFELTDMNPVGPAFDIKKLTWINQQYIQNLTNEELSKQILDFYPEKNIDTKLLQLLIPLIKTRMETLIDFAPLTSFIFSAPDVHSRSDVEKAVVNDLKADFKDISDWSVENILTICKLILEKHGVRMSTLYYLFTGFEKGLPLPDSLAVLGKEEVLTRINDLQ